MAQQARDAEGLTQRDRVALSLAMIKLHASGKAPQAKVLKIAKDVLKRKGR